MPIMRRRMLAALTPLTWADDRVIMIVSGSQGAV